MKNIPVNELSASQRRILYTDFFKINEKLNKELFIKVFLFYGHTREVKIDLYWSALVLRDAGNTIRKTAGLVGLSAQRVSQIERKVMRAIKKYEQQADSSRA